MSRFYTSEPKFEPTIKAINNVSYRSYSRVATHCSLVAIASGSSILETTPLVEEMGLKAKNVIVQLVEL
jgi:hypothetical protein